jgi:hypothetical protein
MATWLIFDLTDDEELSDWLTAELISPELVITTLVIVVGKDDMMWLIGALLNSVSNLLAASSAEKGIRFS